MTKIQNPKPVLVIYYWNLRFVCNLVLGVWDFINSITPADCRKRGKSIETPSNPDLKSTIRNLKSTIPPYLIAPK